jgi:thymidylate synthase (FAD)
MVTHILDHGHIRHIETWGSDERIIEAARQSTGKGFLRWDPGPCPECGGEGVVDRQTARTCPACEGKGTVLGDVKLLRYLYEHHHDTPFEFGGLVVEVQAPIMVFREWHRHRTQGYSEMSARYVQMPNLHYIPSAERIVESAKKSGNRQASGTGAEITFAQAELVRERLRLEQKAIYDNYEDLIRLGVSKEVARIDTPVSRYSRMWATAKLRNWLQFLTLRMDTTAQWEIRQYANAVGDLIAEKFPRTWELYLEGLEKPGKLAAELKELRAFKARVDMDAANGWSP